jgi:hypothetical protein
LYHEDSIRSSTIAQSGNPQGTSATSKSKIRNKCSMELKATSSEHNLDPAAAESNSSEKKSFTLRDRLLKISNVASLLCVIDCTILPIVTILLPLLGMGVAASYATLNARLHHIGHKMALYFVLPVGGFATVMNYLKHEKKRLVLLSSLGMSLVYLANAGHNSPILALFPPKIAHDIHCGTILHRFVNILGCACLLSSNYLAKKVASAAGCCVEHHHSHDKKKSCEPHQDHDGHDDNGYCA